MPNPSKSDQSKATKSELTEGLSEAERMSRIRDLLVGPVIADEQARRDESVTRIDQSLSDQSQSIETLTARLGELEKAHCLETERLNFRLLGLLEALLIDEKVLRARLEGLEQLKPHASALSQPGKGPESAS